ncbi:hypothetical protein GCM10027567_12580 [Spongiibacter taiwanensis]
MIDVGNDGKVTNQLETVHARLKPQHWETGKIKGAIVSQRRAPKLCNPEA